MKHFTAAGSTSHADERVDWRRYLAGGRKFLVPIVLSGGFAVAPGAHAEQALSTDDRAQMDHSRELYERSQQLAREPHVELQDGAAGNILEGPLPNEAPCLTIDQFSIEVPPQLSEQAKASGASELPNDPFHFLLAHLKQYEGSCIGKAGITRILARLNSLVLKRGYTTTRLGIPDQNAAGRLFKFVILPGRIGDVRFEDETTRGVLFNAVSVGDNRLLNLRALEQGLEQLKRVPSQDVSFELVPSANPGETDVVIKVKRDKPWRLGATLDDSGAKSTGRLQAGINAALDNALGMSDLLSVGAVRDAGFDHGRHGTSSTNAAYSFPFRGLTVSLSAFDSSYHQKILGQYQTFMSSGTTEGYDVKASYEFLRVRGDEPGVDSRTSVALKYGERTSRSYIDDAEIGVQFRKSKPVEIGLAHTQYLGSTRIDATLATIRNSEAEYPYRINTVDTSVSQPFTIGGFQLRYLGSLHGQQSHSTLKASQWLSIGNRYSVRGFTGETTIAAEQGAYLRNDLQTPVSLGAFNGAAYWGIDYGQVRGMNTYNLLGRELAGTVCGLRGALGDMQFDIFAGTPIKRPQGFESDLVAGFSLSYEY